MVTKRNNRGPSIKTRLALRFATTLGRIGEILPVGVGYWLSDRCGDVIFAFTPRYRGNVRANLAHVMGLPETNPEVRRNVRRVFHCSSRNFFDLMRVSHFSDDDLRAAVFCSKESWERLDRVREAGKGGIVVSAHFGAFDFTGQTIFSNGYPIIPLTTRTVPEPIYQVVSLLRQSHGLNIEEANSRGVRKVLAALRRGEFAGLLADRDFFHTGIPIEFFGSMTSLPPGPARIARDTGAPIILVFTKRFSKGYVLTVEEPFHVEKTSDVDRDVSLAMARVVRCFERLIRESPEQWVMFQRVWPDGDVTATQPTVPTLEKSLRQVMMESDHTAPSAVGTIAGAPMPTAVSGEQPVRLDHER